MTWTGAIGQPLGRTREEAEEYITVELARAVPSGWKVQRLPAPTLLPGSIPSISWSIARTQIPKGEWFCQEYNVRLAASLELVIFTHGNDDRGMLGLHQCLQHAEVIDAWALRHFGMRACLEKVMRSCKPNEWGYT